MERWSNSSLKSGNFLIRRRINSWKNRIVTLQEYHFPKTTIFHAEDTTLALPLIIKSCSWCRPMSNRIWNSLPHKIASLREYNKYKLHPLMCTRAGLLKHYAWSRRKKAYQLGRPREEISLESQGHFVSQCFIPCLLQIMRSCGGGS
jgi:hypothetical protein